MLHVSRWHVFTIFKTLILIKITWNKLLYIQFLINIALGTKVLSSSLDSMARVHSMLLHHFVTAQNSFPRSLLRIQKHHNTLDWKIFYVKVLT